MKSLGVMLDCSRNAVMKPEKVMQLVDVMAAMGYNMLQLYTEDTFEVPGEPYFGHLRGRYTVEELQAIDAHCKEKGVELVPCVQALAHMNQLAQWDVYQDCFDCFDILLADEEKTYTLMDRVFDALEKSFTSRRVNVGMDEAHFLGLGEYLNRHGYQDRSGILLRHLTRIRDIAVKHGFTLMMWSDMFLRLATGGEYYAPDAAISEEVLKKVPKDIELVYWDYYNLDSKVYDRMMNLHEKFPCQTAFAGGGWTWSGFCPSLGFAEEVTAAAARGLTGHEVRDTMITLWGDDGGECPGFSALPLLYAFAARLRGEEDPEKIRAGFEQITGVRYEDFMKLELPNYFGSHQRRADNSAKLFLYNDPFLGLMDSHIPDDIVSWYESAATQLRPLSESGDYACLFRTALRLTEALAVKADLGLRTRAAYLAGDRAAAQKLADEVYPEVIRRVNAFLEAYTAQWEAVNKPFGFEVQDCRLGGLLQRLAHCRQRLSDWAAGKTDRIAELDQPQLPYRQNWSPEHPLEYRHGRMVTACVMSH